MPVRLLQTRLTETHPTSDVRNVTCRASAFMGQIVVADA